MNTPQYIFDRVVNHLATQRRKAITEYGTCKYRTDDGRRCAIGCLIDDEFYSPTFEGKNVGNRRVQDALIRSLDLTRTNDPFKFAPHLLWKLQGAHDGTNNALELQDRLYVIAKQYGLNSEAVEMITSWKKN